MNILKQLKTGFGGYKKAHQFIWANGLYVYMVLPVLLNVVLFILVTFLGWQYSNELTEWFFNFTGLSGSDWGFLDILRDIVRFLLLISIRLMILLLYMTMFRYIVLILLAPILALLSERVEEIATGKSYPFSFPLLFKNTFRGIIIAIRNGVIEVGMTLALFVFSFIPVVGFVTPVVTFFVESYFFGFSMFDYYGERQGWNSTQTNRVLWRYKAMLTANGMVFNGMLFGGSLLVSIFPLVIGLFLKVVLIVPIIGLSIAPIYSVVAATLCIIDIPQNEKDRLANG